MKETADKPTAAASAVPRPAFPSPAVTAEKQRLRPLCKACRDRIRGSERRAAEGAIMDRLFSLPFWNDAEVICGYVPTQGEIDLSPVWRRAAARNKVYALPCTLSGKREGRMIFRATHGYDPSALVQGRFGIPEPGEDCPVLEPSALNGAILLVPGLSFDTRGYRIGYGGGYYDRFLASCKRAGITVLTVGLVFDDCLAETLPHEYFDIPVHIVLTERRLTVTHGI